MTSFINSWTQGIILAVVITTIIEIILPEGNNKKYIKTVIGIYILFVLVNPLLSKIFNMNIDIDSVIKNTTTKINEYETKDLTIETNAYIEETYISKLKEDITQKVKEKGYNIDFLNLNIETEEEKNYGELNNINMQIVKIEEVKEHENVTKDSVKEINDIKIKISNESITNKEKNIKNEEISEEEKESLKEYLSNEYGTSKEKIYINE